ncbi:uncharacterized protein LOC119074318 [Bradysia coprophila]|nr:uncharacterized protein LOC119074318 [Bradysia coprophila]
MPSGTESTPTSPNATSADADRNLDNINSSEPSLTRTTSHDPTAYVQRARVTRAAPPKPACNPLQFIQIKPCNLYQSAQEQLKRAEEVKKVKETKKEEPEDWQSNLDNWKSCRRKRVEHIIDRVVEVKKLELEEHDRARKKSKTFSEMMEDRNTKGRKVSLAVYVDDEANDLSDLGIGTSTASGKSSLSEDFDNNSVLSDNPDNEKTTFDIDHQNNDNGTREYVSSPGYDTSSTHPPSSPDLCEYTYEGAIQDYKSRVSRAQKSGFTTHCYPDSYPKESNGQAPRKQTSAEIENRLSSFEGRPSNDVEKNDSLVKDDLPKVDIARRRELFEKEKNTPEKRLDTEKMINNLVSDFSQALSIKERLMTLESRNDSSESSSAKTDCLNSELGRVKDILLDIENGSISQHVQPERNAPIDVPVTSLKDRLSTLQETVPTNTEKTVQLNNLASSTEITSSTDQIINQVITTTNENINNNHAVETVEEISNKIEDPQATEEFLANQNFVDQPPFPDVVQEQPNRLLSTINAAIQLVEDQPEDVVKRDASVLEALELAFNAIDSESHHESYARTTDVTTFEHIYENINEIDIEINDQLTQAMDDEPHYQIPKPVEPYYQVPKSKPESLYENVAIVLSANKSVFDGNAKDEYSISMRQKLEPPKEKPPPPPIEDDGEIGDCEDDETIDQSMKRNNSTRRIKKEIRSKRSSFLGIEGSKEDEMESLLALNPNFEDQRLRKQSYIKAGLYSNSDTSESRDSGVSENHSRQSSEEYEDIVTKKDENEVETGEGWSKANSHSYSVHTSPNGKEFLDPNNISEEVQVRYLEGQIREQEEVLRVEKELLQIEQEELKRQRENLLFRRNLTRRELQKGEKNSNPNPNRQSLDNIHYTSNYYVEYPVQLVDYRQSMPNLNVEMLPIDNNTAIDTQVVSAVPPAKPMRANQAQYVNKRQENRDPYGFVPHNRSHFVPPEMSDDLRKSQTINESVHMRNAPTPNGNMTRNTIHALSAVPKPKLRDGWVQSKNLQNRRKTTSDYVNTTEHLHRYNDHKNRENFNYNAHWLIQEAEQRRIDQQRGVRPTTTPWQRNNILRQGSNDDKPLPDAVIKTLTQRVQSKGLGERKRNSLPANISQQRHFAKSHDEPLSISGKKKCSYCNEELGRGAAMIIESLLLFYHLNCFKCFVCRIQLGDGVAGADVRVRNYKLHCQNCFSSDDGIKFSCV